MSPKTRHSALKGNLLVPGTTSKNRPSRVATTASLYRFFQGIFRVSFSETHRHTCSVGLLASGGLVKKILFLHQTERRDSASRFNHESFYTGRNQTVRGTVQNNQETRKQNTCCFFTIVPEVVTCRLKSSCHSDAHVRVDLMDSTETGSKIQLLKGF